MNTNVITVRLPNGKEETVEVSPGTTLEGIAKGFSHYYASEIVAAMVDNDLRELTFSPRDGSVVEFLDMSTEDGMRIYRRSASFILIRAAREVLPGCRVTIEHTLGNGLYGEIHWERPLRQEDIDKIEGRMWEIVRADIPFEKKTLSVEEAIELFRRDGQEDKVRIFKYRQDPMVNIYSCGWFHDYFYGYMVPSSGYVKRFRLRLYLPGFILEFPRKENPLVIPEYVESAKLASIYFEAEKWGQVLGVRDIPALNEITESGRAGEVVRVSEAFHEKKIARIADMIAENRDRLRIILIAGPSSSGKTTFAQRLLVELMVNGLRPITISLDDYFVEREKTPLDESGKPDFESIEAIDIPLFNDHLIRLIQGDEVELPVFDFLEGKRKFNGRKLRIGPDQPIIIEGIHGLNDRLTNLVPKSRKFKIYVSALTQLNLDDHNRIPTTDVRLLRRIVRDNQFRGHKAEDTFRLWPSVRAGEEKNIFPFQEEADIMFNSALAYELAVLKNYAKPLLEGIDERSPVFSEAKRLLKFLNYIVPMDADIVPMNSILREFIGGSCFYETKG